RHNEYLIGRGDSNNAFIHLEIKLLEGRSIDRKSQLGKELLELLKRKFPSSMKDLNLQITVQIIDISRSSYFKYPKGTFTVN
ncbi:MAG: hypothetical protein ACFFCQ_10170, partial [Promethearchaeota archaeon]